MVKSNKLLKHKQKCIFCLSKDGIFTRNEHIIPESLGGDEIMPKGYVCDKCNNYFGREIENDVMKYSPLAFCRSFLGIQNKKKRYPNFKGSRFELFGTNSLPILSLEETKLNYVLKNKEFVTIFPEESMGKLVRFLIKIGLELITKAGKIDVYNSRFNKARTAVRYPLKNTTWKLAETNIPVKEAYEDGKDELGPYTKTMIYHYSLNTFNLDGMIVLTFQYWIHLYSIPLTDGDFEKFIEILNRTNPDFRDFKIRELVIS